MSLEFTGHGALATGERRRVILRCSVAAVEDCGAYRALYLSTGGHKVYVTETAAEVVAALDAHETDMLQSLADHMRTPTVPA